MLHLGFYFVTVYEAASVCLPLKLLCAAAHHRM